MSSTNIITCYISIFHSVTLIIFCYFQMTTGHLDLDVSIVSKNSVFLTRNPSFPHSQLFLLCSPFLLVETSYHFQFSLYGIFWILFLLFHSTPIIIISFSAFPKYKNCLLLNIFLSFLMAGAGNPFYTPKHC